MQENARLTNPVAEKALLGGLLRSPGSYWQVADLVRAGHFTHPFHRDIYTAIKDLSEADRTLSMTAVQSRLPTETEDGQSTEVYLAVLFANSEDVGNPLDYAEEVAAIAGRRQLKSLGDKISKAALSGEKMAIDIAGEAESEILDILRVTAPKRPRRLSDVVKKVVHDSNRAWQDDVPAGLMTGIHALDEILGLMLPADLGFILASQGDGKTALAMQIATHVSYTKPVLFAEAEMTGDGLAVRSVAGASGVSVREIHEGAFEMDQWQRVLDAENNLQRPELYILDERRLTVRQLRSHGLAIKRTRGLGMMVVDQLDKTKAEGRFRDRFERTAEVTADYKDLAKELGVPILVLAQRTRMAQRRDDPEPQINDADAPSLERDGDWVLALWMKSNWLQQNKPSVKAGGEAWDRWENELRSCRGTAEIMMLKHRRRQAFEKRMLRWNGPIMRFEDI